MDMWLGKLAGKKGLIAITLAMAAVFAGALAPAYYTWKFSYDITPLTTNIEITLPPTTGATVDWIYIIPPEWTSLNFEEVLGDCVLFRTKMEEDTIRVIGFPGTEIIYASPMISVKKPVDVWFYATEGDANKLNASYWYLTVGLYFYEHNDENGNGTPYEFVCWTYLYLVVEQDPTLRVLSNFEDLMWPGDYDVVIIIYSWTGAVGKGVADSFTIFVYAVEKPWAA